MKKRLLISLMMFNILLVYSTSITFSFDNVQINGESTRFLEFDIMAKAGEAGTLLGSNQVYLQYNTQAFGDSLFQNDNIEVTKGSLLAGELVPGLPLYNDFNLADNAVNIIGIQTEYFSSGLAAMANELPTEYSDLVHIIISIQDTIYLSGISLDQSLMVGQQYESDIDTIYEPITIEGDLNIYLRKPEQPTISSIERSENLLTISWSPTVATTYYEVLISDLSEGPFLLDTSGAFSNTTWTTTINSTDKKKFYRVIAHN